MTMLVTSCSIVIAATRGSSSCCPKMLVSITTKVVDDMMRVVIFALFMDEIEQDVAQVH